MTLFDIISILIALASLFGYINHRWLRLPPTVGLLMISLATSLALMLLHTLFPALTIVDQLRSLLGGIDFNEALMRGMLGFLLFAGALHVDLEYFVRSKGTIASLATIGLFISTLMIGTLSWLLFNAVGLPISFLACLVFGSLISPTDPIAVMGTLKTLNAPKDLEANIAGESLFNDGVAVVLFTGLVALLAATGSPAPEAAAHTAGALATHAPAAAHAAASTHGPASVTPGSLALLFLREAGGGALLGLICGYIVYRLMLSIDEYRVEVMLTLALVMSSYSIAGALHLSGPIAVVVAGIFIGNRGRAFAMSPTVADYVGKFWELIDEILNAMLFVLIGIEVLVVSFSTTALAAGAVVILIVLLARLASVAIPIAVIGIRARFPRGVVPILTWSGLRGGISVALALSLPPSPERSIILTCTYMVVLFSILVQGLTVERVLRRYLDG
jgi:CPA1 family monovalent cation:H+ antiporter